MKDLNFRKLLTLVVFKTTAINQTRPNFLFVVYKVLLTGHDPAILSASNFKFDLYTFQHRSIDKGHLLFLSLMSKSLKIQDVLNTPTSNRTKLKSLEDSRAILCWGLSHSDSFLSLFTTKSLILIPLLYLFIFSKSSGIFFKFCLFVGEFC